MQSVREQRRGRVRVEPLTRGLGTGGGHASAFGAAYLMLRSDARAVHVCPTGAGRGDGQSPLPKNRSSDMNTRTIAILALVVAVILVIIIFLV